MKKRSFLVPFACLSLAAPAMADTFVMKDGSRLEGKIVKDNGATYDLEVQVTKSIRDAKTVAKADISEIIEEKVDETEFEKLKKLVPVPDLIPNEEYDRRIITMEKFLKQYPKSAKAKEAEEILSTLKAEGATIQSGGLKLGGKVYTAQEYLDDQYDLDARVLEARIRETVARGDILGALRGTQRMDEDFKPTNSRAAIQPLKKQVLRAYKNQIDEWVNTLDARIAERDAGLARMSAANRAGTEQALREEVEQVEIRYAADMKNNQLWVTTHPFHKESLERTQEVIEEELIDDGYKAPGDAGKIYRNALRLIKQTEDQGTVREILYKADEVGIPKKYIKNLQDIATQKGVTF